MLENILLFIGMMLTLYVVFSLMVVLLGSAITDYYEFGMHRDSPSIIDKICNVLMICMFGPGLEIHQWLERKGYSWIKRKLIMLGVSIGLAIISIPIYYTLKAILYLIY